MNTQFYKVSVMLHIMEHTHFVLMYCSETLLHSSMIVCFVSIQGCCVRVRLVRMQLNSTHAPKKMTDRGHSTLNEDEVLGIFKEPYIRSGYRQAGKPLYFYLASLFHLHNDTLNIWTHLLPSVYYVYKIHEIGQEVDFYNDVTSWGVLVLSLSGLLYTALSTLAHTFQAKSEMHHLVLYQLDFIGIGLYIYGAGVSAHYYIAPEYYYAYSINELFVPVSAGLSLLFMICSSAALLLYRPPYPPQKKLWNLGSGLLAATWCIIPTVVRQLQLLQQIAFPDKSDPANTEESMTMFFLYVIASVLLVMALWCFGSHYPERMSPGKFDIYGHSHMLFHVFASAASVIHLKVTILEHRVRLPHLVQTAQPTFGKVFGVHLGLLLCQCTLVLLLHGVRKKKILGERQINEKDN